LSWTIPILLADWAVLLLPAVGTSSSLDPNDTTKITRSSSPTVWTLTRGLKMSVGTSDPDCITSSTSYLDILLVVEAGVEGIVVAFSMDELCSSNEVVERHLRVSCTGRTSRMIV
jgi:hypothetical protein